MIEGEKNELYKETSSFFCKINLIIKFNYQN